MTTDEPALDTAPDTAPDTATASAPDPEQVLAIAGGFMSAKHLFVASELGLFEALSEGNADLVGLAARTGLTTRAARISADAMVALGLLTCSGGVYANTPAATAFLAGGSPVDLRPLLRFWDRISYPAWLDLAGALARGPKHEIVDLDDELAEIASSGIEAFQAGPSALLPEVLPFPDGTRLLDVGGGTGSWSTAVVRRHAGTEAAVFELPVVADIARQHLAEAGLTDRVAVLSGDATEDEFPAGFDTFLLANVVHYWSPEGNRDVLRRLRAVAPTDGRVLLVDFWTDATHTRPFAAAMMAGEFAAHVQHGDVHSVDEAREWLATTGWRYVEQVPLTGPMSVVVGRAA